MFQTSQPVDKPVSAVLSEIIQTMPAEGLTLQTLLQWLGERGLLIFSMVLTLPFLLPVSIPGTSAPFGLLIALNALGLAMHKSPWLPARLMSRRIAAHQLGPMLEKGAHLFARLEKLIRPRLLILTHRASMGRLNVMVLGLSGLLLTAPLPLPFSNTLPAYGVLFLAIGNLERDGYAVLAGYLMVFLSIGYFATIAILGGLGATALSSFLEVRLFVAMAFLFVRCLRTKRKREHTWAIHADHYDISHPWSRARQTRLGDAWGVGEVRSMSEHIMLNPVDHVEIITLYENLVDQTAPGGGVVERLRPRAGDTIVSTLLAEERRNPFVGGHGLSMLVRVRRQGIARAILFDAGGSPDGLAYNLDCLELNPRDWNCIVLSHGHWDHTLGLVGLHRRLGRLGFPLTLHPDAYLKRAVIAPDGEVNRLVPLSRQGLRDAGLELIETERPSFVVEGMALVTGQVARTNDFEIGWPAHHAERDGVLEPDPLICDDQGLVINVRGKGLVVLSGCGHAGIVNTVHHAQAITGVQQVHAVIGGFHLGPTFFHDRIRRVVDALVALEPAVIAPAHCTGYRAAYAVYQQRPDAFVQNTVGTRIVLSAD